MIEPGAEVRERFNRRLVERATQAGADRAASPALGTFDSPDSYLRLWRVVFERGTVVGAALAAVVAVLALAGRAFGSDLLAGEIFGSRSLAALSAILMLLLAAAALALRKTAPKGFRRTFGDLTAGLACLSALIALAVQISGSGLFPGEFLRTPASSNLLLAALLGIGLIAVDRDGPHYRFSDRLVPLIGLVALVGLLSRGYRLDLISGTLSAEMSPFGLLGLGALVVAYLALRPDRGLAGFMVSGGPGPAMARLLAPAVLAIPLAMTVGQRATGAGVATSADVIRWVDEMVVMTALVAVITYTSRRLQSYFEDWRRAAEELREQADVLAAMAEGVALLRLSDDRLILTNPQFDRMHGYEPGELVGKPISAITPEDLDGDEMLTRKRVAEDLLEEGRSGFESRALRRDGTVIRCRTNSILTTDPQHGAVLIIVKSDITAEYEAKLAGAAAEARFRQVFEQSPIGLALVRPDGSLDRVNQGFEDLTGYRAEELQGMTFSEITHPDDLAEDLRRTGEMFRGETDGFEMEKRYIRRDGGVVRVELRAVMLRDSSGEPTVALAMARDVTAHHEMSLRLRRLADHDPLTGLFNRRRLERELQRTVSGADGSPGRGLAVMMVDLDNFKFINDNYGHTVGDRLIVRTSEVLKGRLRQGDVLARQGGDEFVLLLRDVSAGEAVPIARELVRKIAADARVEGPGFLARATASIGVAVSPDGAAVDPERLIREADIAMYEVKDSGRNDAGLYDSSRPSEVTRGIDWHQRIRRALDRDGFTLHSQPLVSLRDDPLPHYELFLRLTHPDGRLVAPSAFMPVAERYNMVGEIDRWVVRRAIRLLARCEEGRAPRLFVNLSGQSVGDMDLLSLIEEELALGRVDPDLLVFEVTETSAIADIDRAQRFTAALSLIGCHTALDDFGAGFASFYYLKHVPSDYVKIDGEFIRNLQDDPTSKLLVRALTDLSRGLGKQVVAEHVEDERALELLQGYGVDLVQGYLLGRPRPARPEDMVSPARGMRPVRR